MGRPGAYYRKGQGQGTTLPSGTGKTSYEAGTK